MKLECGMYVRTDKGIIGKIYEKIRDRFTYKDSNRDYITYGLIHNEILKASFNIIDLIEVGDYVNGMKVKNIMSVGTSQYVIRKGDGKYVCCGEYGKVDDGSGKSCYALQWNNNQIKEVLTHEQYEANCYKVVE